MGTIVCCKNLCGIWPLSSENLHIIYIGLESSVAHSFNITAGNLSGPAAEYVGISLIALMKSASLNSISSITANTNAWPKARHWPKASVFFVYVIPIFSGMYVSMYLCMYVCIYVCICRAPRPHRFTDRAKNFTTYSLLCLLKRVFFVFWNFF